MSNVTPSLIDLFKHLFDDGNDYDDYLDGWLSATVLDPTHGIVEVTFRRNDPDMDNEYGPNWSDAVYRFVIVRED